MFFFLVAHENYAVPPEQNLQTVQKHTGVFSQVDNKWYNFVIDVVVVPVINFEDGPVSLMRSRVGEHYKPRGTPIGLECAWVAASSPHRSSVSTN